MALRPDYCTLAELKAHLRITDTADDTALAVCITSASRAIDQYCYRPFGITGSAIQRLFTWHGQRIDGAMALCIDDLMTTVGLVVTADTVGDFTYSTTLVLNTDFDLYPYNAIADAIPFTHLIRRETSVLSWPAPASSVRAFSVTANWGWATVPSSVEIATLIQAARYFVRRDSPYGISGSPDLGSEVRLLAQLDPDVQSLLNPYRKMWGAV